MIVNSRKYSNRRVLKEGPQRSQRIRIAVFAVFANSWCALRLKNYFSVYPLLTLFVFAMPCRIFSQNKAVVFRDVTTRAGIDFRYTFGDYSYFNILESSGSGITVFDYNNDKLMDLFMMNGTYLEGISDPAGKVFRNSSNKLYKNNGNGTFTDVTRAAGLGGAFWSMAAAPVDPDNRGFQDLYLLNYGPNIYYRNNGNGTFTPVTGKLGLEGPEKLNGFTKWSIGASFWDFNNDGRLDVMVGNFLAFDPKYDSPVTPGKMPDPSEYNGQASMLYEQGSDGVFRDVTRKYKLFYPDSKCMGLTVYDYDCDGDIDIFQANDHQLNFLFRNDEGTYYQAGVQCGVAANSQGVGTGSMHGTLGDVDGDGLIDLVVTDLSYGAYYHNLGNGLFEDLTYESGLAGAIAGKGGWGAVLFDYDNDGDLDFFSAMGTAEELILQYPVLMENDGSGHFRDIGREHGAYFSTRRSGRGVVKWDYDNDGDIDLIISHVDLKATPSLLRNDGGNANNWIGITLAGKGGVSSAVAARVIITAGGKRQVMVNQWATSYLSNSDPRIHAGIGKAMIIDKIEIFWPDGQKEELSAVRPNRYITVREGTGIVQE